MTNPTTAMGTSPVTYSDEDGALPSARATHEPSPAVSALRVTITNALKPFADLADYLDEHPDPRWQNPHDEFQAGDFPYSIGVGEVHAARDAYRTLSAPAANAERCPIDRVWSRIEMEAEAVTLDNEETVSRVGLRDGFSEAVQLLDMLTGGDGEYRFCTIPDERHCPTPVEMGRRIIARIETLTATLKVCDDAINEMFRYFDGGETRGSYDGKPERNQLRKAGYAARAMLAKAEEA